MENCYSTYYLGYIHVDMWDSHILYYSLILPNLKLRGDIFQDKILYKSCLIE